MSTVTTTHYRVESELLTQRQAEILGWLAEGETLVGIARRTGLTPQTAQVYGQDLKAVMDVATHAEAVAQGFATGTITVLPPEAA